MANRSRQIRLFIAAGASLAAALCATACTIEFIDNDDPPLAPDIDGGQVNPPSDGPHVCGNGIVEAGEVCDDGNNQSGDGCSSDCQSIEVCGNGVVDAGESCDDGNNQSGDGCNNMCQLEGPPACGDGVISAPEECDNGQPNVNTATCDRDCTFPVCGDSLPNFPAGEQCDTGGASASCDVDCTATVCGDGLVNPAAGEQCDDGNSNNNDGCRNNCTLPPP